MEKIELFKRIISGSMRFCIDGTKLTLYSYHTGEAITIDLEKIDEYILEDIIG